MSGNETAGKEARRSIVTQQNQSGTGVRHDALLRYLRGLYVRNPQARQAPDRSRDSAGGQQGPGEAEADPAIEPPIEPTTA